MRAFIAVVADASDLDRLAPLQQELLRRVPQFHPQPRDNLHLTLAFLGEQSVATLEETRSLVLSVGGQTAPISTRIQGLQLLGHGQRKRPLCLMLEPVMALIELHRRLNDGLAGLGLETETRRYHPHLTLGRVSPPPPAPTVLADLAPDEPMELHFERLVLFRSRLLPGGAEHSALAEVDLTAATTH